MGTIRVRPYELMNLRPGTWCSNFQVRVLVGLGLVDAGGGLQLGLGVGLHDGLVDGCAFTLGLVVSALLGQSFGACLGAGQVAVERAVGGGQIGVGRGHDGERVGVEDRADLDKIAELQLEVQRGNEVGTSESEETAG
jgi:hypothetical protein